MYEVEGKMPTIVQLELATDQRIQFLSNIGKGEIDYANISNFESLSGDGLLIA